MGNNYRKESTSGFYHVMGRGVNKQNIFDDDNDKKVYLSLMKKFQKKDEIEIHAFCLMDNHFHILLKSQKNDMSMFMQKLLSSYVRYFNYKTGRIGHLFESRYKSEVVEDDEYYLTVVRYILQNPEKAMICKTAEYKWSSYTAFFHKSFVITDYIEKMFVTRKHLLKFIQENNYDECLDVALNPEEKDTRAELIINFVCKSLGEQQLRDLSKVERDVYLQKIKNYGISVRKISKITKIGINIVQRA